MDLGEGFSFNLYTPSKFYLYKKWSFDNSNLGERCAKVFNIVLNLASAVGTRDCCICTAVVDRK